jgi:hypothetical protein
VIGTGAIPMLLMKIEKWKSVSGNMTQKVEEIDTIINHNEKIPDPENFKVPSSASCNIERQTQQNKTHTFSVNTSSSKQPNLDRVFLSAKGVLHSISLTKSSRIRLFILSLRLYMFIH